MRLGDFELHLICAGGWRPDGGTMFGVVPKVLWERHKPSDEGNLIDAACVALVVRHRGRTVVVETGIGTKLEAKRAAQSGVWSPDALLGGLRRLGIRPDEVDMVTASHLHWDHSGGLTRRSAAGAYELTFPRARLFVQRREWDFALDPDVRSRPAFLPQDILPVEARGLLELVDGDVELLPGLSLQLTGGHTPGHQIVTVAPNDELAVVFTGDLIPMRPHLRLGWTAAADLDLLATLRAKALILDRAQRHRQLLVLSHEMDSPAGYLGQDGTWTAEPELPLPPPEEGG
ncbi:MAG TPA: MBL fold metallo-hydrolase [Candidatus Nitrosotalea sp.]|nr:MBL fold metallo-hydrolase [Candidatus Nitrosotalea sp.]